MNYSHITTSFPSYNALTWNISAKDLPNCLPDFTNTFSSIVAHKSISPEVKSIRFDKKFTTVTWSDNTTTRVGCMLGDEYNKYEAFCSALAKKIFGSTSKVKHIVDTKDEQIEIDKQRREREAQETAAKIRKARKDRIWIKRRAKEIAREKAAQELADKMIAAKS